MAERIVTLSASVCSSQAGSKSPVSAPEPRKVALVALAFLLGKADHLEAERQAPAGAVQLAHAGHRHEDAQPAVVLAAVAHGVEVRAGQQAPGGLVRAVIDARRRCPPRPPVPRRSRIRRASSAAAVRRRPGAPRSVSDGQLALLLEAGVPNGRPGPRPSPRPGCPDRATCRTCRSGRISAIRWMLRRHSARSKSGWPSSRRAKVAMISALGKP